LQHVKKQLIQNGWLREPTEFKTHRSQLRANKTLTLLGRAAKNKWLRSKVKLLSPIVYKKRFTRLF
jgi:hypothetical protein